MTMQEALPANMVGQKTAVTEHDIIHYEGVAMSMARLDLERLAAKYRPKVATFDVELRTLEKERSRLAKEEGNLDKRLADLGGHAITESRWMKGIISAAFFGLFASESGAFFTAFKAFDIQDYMACCMAVGLSISITAFCKTMGTAFAATFNEEDEGVTNEKTDEK